MIIRLLNFENLDNSYVILFRVYGLLSILILTNIWPVFALGKMGSGIKIMIETWRFGQIFRICS